MAATVNSFSLTGRVALVTGGAGRLGQAICIGLAEAGARVLVNGRDAEKTEALAKEIRGRGLLAESKPFDVTDHLQSARIIGELDRLDILVNNASPVRSGTVASTAPAAFGELAAGVVEAAYALSREALPLLRMHGTGSIINIASMYGTVSPDPGLYGESGYNNPPQYGVAKAGLIQLTRYLACHLAADGIRVNTISPGPFPDREMLAREQPAFLKALENKVPLKRVGIPTEVSGSVVFLASDASSYVTGANIPVDGGWTAW